MKVIINMGSGGVQHGSIKQSEANIKQFIADMGVKAKYKFLRIDEDGRHAYKIKHKGNKDIISMPALPIEMVRYTGAEGQRISHYPRLFVNYSSFVWIYAVGVCLKRD